MPAKPLLSRANNEPDYRETTFNPVTEGGRKRCGEANEQIFEQDFTLSNYGFHRGRSQHQAIAYVKKKVEEGYSWCASIDLRGFFDEIPPRLDLEADTQKDCRRMDRVTLVARALKAAVVVGGR